MRILSRSGRILSGATTLAMLAACSGGGSQAPAFDAPSGTMGQAAQNVRAGTVASGERRIVVPPGMRPSTVVSARRAPFVNVAGINATQGNQTFITDAGSATVTVWGGAGQLNAILYDGIAAGPTGLTTDTAENLYVANEAYGNVIVYAKPYTAITLTLDDAGQDTDDVAVSQTGVVGVTNYLTSALQPGSVKIYAKGATSACATVADPRWIYYDYDAFDASGNLFIVGQNLIGDTLVGEIAGGCKATSITTLSVGNVLSSPGGIAVSQGKILIEDPQKQTIYTYALPSGGSLGSPTATTTLAGAVSSFTFAMMDGGQNLWAADFNPFGFVGKYAYPSGTFVKSISQDLFSAGVAVNPAAKP